MFTMYKYNTMYIDRLEYDNKLFSDLLGKKKKNTLQYIIYFFAICLIFSCLIRIAMTMVFITRGLFRGGACAVAEVVAFLSMVTMTFPIMTVWSLTPVARG